MHEDGKELARLAAAASYLLLHAPDERTVRALGEQTGQSLDLATARQDFIDHLCIAQSGRFLPPYAHVLNSARETEEFWYLPQARFDGGDALLSWYDVTGFRAADLPCDALLDSPGRPLDHVGVVLAFLALLLDASGVNDADGRLLGEFVAEHIKPWSVVFTRLLSQSGSIYLGLLGEALADLVDALSMAYPSFDGTGKARERAWIPIRADGAPMSATVCVDRAPGRT